MSDKDANRLPHPAKPRPPLRQALFASGSMVVNVGSFMWMRTTINRQYRYGGSFWSSLKILYKEGGIFRLYRGLPFALFQAPLVRMGDVAANSWALSLIGGKKDHHKGKPDKSRITASTMLASFFSAAWRVLILPIDQAKTYLQVEGSFVQYKNHVRQGGFVSTYSGASTVFPSKMLSFFPWFLTFNLLNQTYALPEKSRDRLLRNGLIGLAASATSDCCTNWLRVFKTMKQTLSTDSARSYAGIANSVGATIFTRGLMPRVVCNGIQSATFTIMWMGMMQRNRKD